MSAQESVEEKHLAICFVSSTAPDAEAARQKLIARYGDVPIEQAQVIVALGGDGLMLQTLDRKSTRLNSSHRSVSRMPSSA